MARRNEKTLHIGADLEVEFVKGFREYVSREETRYSQSLLIKRLIEWWMQQESMVQDHIYRGRFELISFQSKQPPVDEQSLQAQILFALKDLKSEFLKRDEAKG